jgi:hypothetical protein
LSKDAHAESNTGHKQATRLTVCLANMWPSATVLLFQGQSWVLMGEIIESWLDYVNRNYCNHFFLISTNWSQFSKYDLNHKFDSPLMPYEFSLTNNISRFITSYTFDKSKNNPVAWNPMLRPPVYFQQKSDLPYLLIYFSKAILGLLLMHYFPLKRY